MNKRLTAIIAVILCMALSVMFGMTVTATETDGQSSTTSVSSEQTVDTSSTESTGTETSSESDVSSDAQSEVSSGESTSSEATDSGDGSSNTDTNSTSGSTSSETTSSKVNKPIYSGGGADGNKFVEQDFSSGTSSTTSSTVSTTSSSVTVSDEPIGDEYVDDPEGDENHYQSKATTVAGDIYKIIWIPALISVLCIAALVTVNVMFKKKYPKTSKSGSDNGPRRRNTK